MNARKSICYRVNNGPCQKGWQDTTCAASDTTVFTLANGGVAITDVVIVPCGDCPAEVVVVSTPPPPPLPKFDREMVTLCTPSGTKVIVQNVTPEDAPLGTAPVFEAWNLNGTAYTGAVSALVDCGADKVNTEHTDYCAGGLNFTRVDGLAEGTGVPVWTIWLDDAGLPVAQPVGAVKGKCEVCQPKPCCPRTTFYNAGTCREIKVVDTLQCDGTYTTQGFELNNTVIAGFDPSKLVAECPCVLLSAANLQTWA